MNCARHLAARLLVEMERRRCTLDRLLENYSGRIEKLAYRDRALFHNLVYGAIRWQGKLDSILAGYSRKPIAKLDAGVRVALRLGLFQILYLDRVPDSAAVNTAVEIAKDLSGKWTGAFVNAILRSALRGRDATGLTDREKDPAARLAVAESMPLWLVRRWIRRFGFRQTERLCRFLNQVPDIVLRVNRLKTGRRKVLEAVRPHVRQAVCCRAAPDGIMLRGIGRPVTELPGFDDGFFQVQAEASQLVALLLEPEPGMKIWDACAGLGTKTCQLAAMIRDRGKILATDNNRRRLASLGRETVRLGIGCIRTRAMDLLATGKNGPGTEFDRILLDAPCSSLGVIQKNPDVKWTSGPERLEENGRRQLAMLRRAARFLRPGGILVYSVCSFEPEETTWVLERFLKTEKKFDIYLPRDFPWLPDAITPAGFLQILPHEHGTDGFFAAAVKHRT